MVVTHVGGLVEMVPDGKVGFQCEPEPASIATAIEKYYVQQREADMTEAIREEKQHYSWNRMATETEKLGGID